MTTAIPRSRQARENRAILWGWWSITGTMGESTSPSTLKPSSSRRDRKKLELSRIWASFCAPTLPPISPVISRSAARACAAHGGAMAEAQALPGAFRRSAEMISLEAAT